MRGVIRFMLRRCRSDDDRQMGAMCQTPHTTNGGKINAMSSHVAGGAQHDLLPSTGGVASTANRKPCEGSYILEGGDKLIWRKFVYPTGTRYEGYMKGDMREGHGVYIDKNANQYEGQWKNDRAQGYGVKLFAKGDRHEGEYKNDKRNGYVITDDVS